MIPLAIVFTLLAVGLLAAGVVWLTHTVAGMREVITKFDRLEERVDRTQDTLETILLGDLTKAEIQEAIRRGFDANRRAAERATVRR